LIARIDVNTREQCNDEREDGQMNEESLDLGDATSGGYDTLTIDHERVS
jgi:hypothetical protein